MPSWSKRRQAKEFLQSQRQLRPAWLRCCERLVKPLLHFRKQVFMSLTVAVSFIPPDRFDSRRFPRSWTWTSTTPRAPAIIRNMSATGMRMGISPNARNVTEDSWGDHPKAGFATTQLNSRPPLPASSNILSEAASSSSRASRPSTRTSLTGATPMTKRHMCCASSAGAAFA